MPLMNNDIDILKEELVAKALLFYPVHIRPGDEGYDSTPEKQRLVKTVAEHERNKKWHLLLDKMKALGDWISLSDLTAYSYFSPCFKGSIALRQGEDRFHVRIYISMLTKHFAYKVNKMYPNESLESEAFLTMNKQEQMAFLTQLQEKIEKFERENRTYINSYPASISSCMAILLDCERNIFGYELFPETLMNKIVPDIAINMKNFGDITLFDCFFTDWEIPAG